MDHKVMLELNAQYIQSFVVKHIGKPKRLGEMLFNEEIEIIRKQYDEVDCTEPDAVWLSLHALQRASYKLGLYAVDHVNVLPHGTCGKVMLGLNRACFEVCDKAMLLKAHDVWNELKTEFVEEQSQQEEDEGPEYDTGSGWVDP